MEEATMTLKDLVDYHIITAKVTYGAPPNPDMPNMDPWTVVIRYEGRQMTVPFYMGHGHNGAEPKVYDVLDCLLSDASGVDNSRGFEDWANDMGFDADSRKAERIYKACERTSERLRRLLGDDYETFLYAERG